MNTGSREPPVILPIAFGGGFTQLILLLYSWLVRRKNCTRKRISFGKSLLNRGTHPRDSKESHITIKCGFDVIKLRKKKEGEMGEGAGRQLACGGRNEEFFAASSGASGRERWPNSLSARKNNAHKKARRGGYSTFPNSLWGGKKIGRQMCRCTTCLPSIAILCASLLRYERVFSVSDGG